MQNYTFTREVPLWAAADVVVIGGGPAGVAAALAARRCHRSVFLLERSGQLGGMATLGGVAIWMGVGNLTGFYAEIVRDLGLADHQSRDWQATRKFAPAFDPFRLRLYLSEKLAKEGATVHFHTEFIGALKEQNRLAAVVVHTREGLRAVVGKAFVDATGDARVAIEAGVPYRSGRETDHLTQPMTLMFLMQDTGRPVAPSLPPGCPRYERVEELPQGRRLYWEDKATGRLLVNMSRVRGNGARAEDASAAEREALRQVFGVADYLQRNGFPNHILSHVAAQTGVRETNQIEGLYTLTEEDLTAARRFDDVVAQTNYGIDVHNPLGGSGCLQKKLEIYDIPYRCLVPRSGPENLLVAGRALSATHVAMSSARVMPTCFALGQAAGAAAAWAVEHGVSMKDVPSAGLQELLKSQGVVFER